MEHGNINNKKKLCIKIVVIIFILLFGGGIAYFILSSNDNLSFEENDKLYFEMFVELYDSDEAEFYSLDAYYLEDTQMYYYNAKFKGYSSIEEMWYDVDKISYGRIKKFYNSYCRSWDDLYGFEDEDKEFERAKKEGIHKTYTKEEIDKLLEEAYRKKESN